MSTSDANVPSPGSLLSLSAALNRTETIEDAANRTAELANAAFEQPTVAVCEYDPATEAFGTVGASIPLPGSGAPEPDGVPEGVVERIRGRSDDPSVGVAGEPTVDADPRGPLRAEAFVPAGSRWVLRLGVTEPTGFDGAGMGVVEGIAANLGAVLERIEHQQQRRREFESFRRAVEEAADGVAILEDGEYEYVDRTHVDMYGFDSKDDLLGDTWRKLYDDDEVARLEAEAFPALEADGYWRGGVTGSRPDGSTFPAELSLTVVEDGRLVCTVRDETERRARERELELKEQAMDEATVGIQITDPTRDDNPLIYVNDGFERMTGYTEEEALGRNPRFLQGAETDPEHTARLREAIEAEDPVSLELENHRKDGTPYWARISVTPVTDRDGAVTNYVGIQQDVTERRARNQWLQEFLNRGPLLFVRTRQVDGEAVVDSCNDRFLHRLGYDRGEVEGEPLASLYTAESTTDLREGGYEDALTGAFGMNERTLVGAGGESVHTLLRAVPRRDGTDGTNALFVDISERRDARERLRHQRERLELTLSGTDTGITTWILETDELRSDGTFVDLVGRDVDTGEAYFEEVVHPDDRDRVRQALDEGLATGALPTMTAEYRVLTGSGDTRWLRSRAVPEYDDDGNPVRVLAMVTDISETKAEERERRRNERRFQSLFDDPGMLVALLDTDGTLLDVNTTAVEYVEPTAAELTGQPFAETPWWSHSAELRSDVREWIRRAADGEYVEYSAIHRRPDGKQRHIAGTVRPVTDAEGTVTSLLVSGRDVTERERQRRVLEDRQRKLDLVLSNTDTSVTELDLAEGTVRWERMAGNNDIGSPETLEEFFETVHPEDRERVRTAVETLEHDGEPVALEFRFVEADGSVVWVAAQAVPVTGGAGTAVESVVGIATEITELKQREQALEDSQQRYRTLLEAAPDPIFVADVETGEIVEANAAAEAVRGQPREDIVGLDQTSLHPEADAEVYADAFEQSAEDTGIVTALPEGVQPELRDVDGGTIPVEINATSVQLPDGPALYGVFRDITDREERKRELEAFQQAVEEAADGVAILEDGEYVYIDRTHAEMYGFDSKDDLLGDSWRKLYDDEEVERLENEAFPALEADGHWRGSATGSRPDGATFPTELSLTVVEDGRIVCVVRDETERRARKRELELKERAMDEANVGITISDPNREDNPLVYVNDGFVEQTGYTSEEALGRNRRFLLNGDVDQPGVDELRDAIAAEESTAVQLRNYRKDSTQFWNRLSVTPVYSGDDLVNYIGIQQDVTDEVRRKRRLYEERERFRLLTESVDEYAFLVVDGDGAVRTWNAGAENLFGYDADVALGTSIAELHPESDRESGRPERLLQQARIAGESADEGWRVRADGTEFYADVRYAPLEADDGEFRGYAMIVRDQTERRRQRRRTERFVEESEDVVTVVDTDGTIAYASGSAERQFGYDPDALVGQNLFDHLHPAGRERAMEAFFECVEESDSVTAECRLQSPDGEWFNVDVRYRNMVDDDAIDGMLVYLRDVTESTERARRFESIFNQAFQFTALLEPDGTVVEVNDSALEFGGFGREEVVGAPFFEAPWWTHSEAVYDQVRDAIERAAGGEFVRHQTDVRGGSGLATIDFSLKPVTDDDGDVSLLVAEGRNITSREQHRRHLEVMQRVVRHNMRNDLTKVRGWAQLMSEAGDADRRAEAFEVVERVLDKWESMSGKMRDITQLLRGQRDHRSTTECEAVVVDAAESVREADNGVTVATETADAGPVQVRTTVRSAVHELIENAAEAGDDATIEVELTHSEGDWIEIRVRDDGPGMPEMEADVLESGEETPLNHGLGLGLWMVRMVVTQAGGTVSVESPTRGTEVCLRLPATPGGRAQAGVGRAE